MSIIIKGMEMPKSCIYCELYEAEWFWCRAAKKEYYETIENKAHPDWCPLVPVPPHGRLIEAGNLDARAFRYLLMNGEESPRVVFAQAIKDAPTIIPAEEGET